MQVLLTEHEVDVIDSFFEDHSTRSESITFCADVVGG